MAEIEFSPLPEWATYVVQQVTGDYAYWYACPCKPRIHAQGTRYANTHSIISWQPIRQGGSDEVLPFNKRLIDLSTLCS